MSEDTEPDEDGTNPLRRTLEILVYAPVGVAMTVAEDLPALVSKGRRRVESHLRNAHFIGRFVVTKGQNDLGQRVDKLLKGEPPAAPPARSAAASPDASAAPKPAPDPADVEAVERALAGYDTLSASQVVRRLESLGPEELRAVHRHEASHRNRRTILNRADQLLEVDGTRRTDGIPGPPAEPDTA